jgi:hypothetical protein
MRNYVYPGNVVSWKFDAPATGQSVGILVPEGTPDHIKIIAYNLDPVPVKSKMTGWEIDPGKWEITQGVQGASGDAALSDVSTRTVEFERSRDHSLGSVDAPASKVVLRDKAGKVLASASVPAIKAPIDLLPKTAAVVLTLPAGADWKGGSVTVESSGKLPEITQMNNRVPL